MKLDLRDYQAEGFESIRDHIRHGARSVMLVAPTGSGKTVLSAALMEMTRDKGNRATFVIDRLSLLDQASRMFDNYGIEHGVVQAQHERYQPWQPVQVCSVQTLSRRQWPESQLDVLDEAHVLHAAHKRRIASREAVTVGPTATPFTKGLGQYFDALVNVTTTRQLIRDGWLVPYRIFSCAEPDMAGVKVKAGEWDETESSKRALEVVGDVVEEYLKHGEGRKFICSAVDTRHVEELAKQFREAGIVVATYTYRDKVSDRQDSVEEFRKHDSRIRGLITVTAASRGFDVPDVSCVIAARPLRKSLAEHIQLFGRGLRISPETGKSDCLVLDHAGNFSRFYAATEAFFNEGCHALDDGSKPETKTKPAKEVEPRVCPSCHCLHSPQPRCPACGHEYPRKAPIRHVAGTLKEMLAGGSREQLTVQVWPQICAYARASKPDDDIAARKYALALYRDMTGAWPKGEFEQTPNARISIEVQNRIRYQQIKWAKRRRA